jgi:hypothetical protein
VSDRLGERDGPMARFQGARVVAGELERVHPDRQHAGELFLVAQPLDDSQCLVHAPQARVKGDG